MIPEQDIKSAKTTIPWQSDFMVEQDMVIDRALVALYNKPNIRKHLIFRGGTALNKLFLNPPARYSEDIDFVLVRRQPIGFLIDEIREALGWLGRARTKRHRFGFKVIYVFENVDGGKSKLKIETNTTENFIYNPLKTVPFSLQSNWFSGATSVVVYNIDELMATKIRALYQRRKGRDLFDVWYVFSKKIADVSNAIKIFHAYNNYNGIKITQKVFMENMRQKAQHRDFRQDMRALLPLGTGYSFEVAFDFLMKEIAPRI